MQKDFFLEEEKVEKNENKEEEEEKNELENNSNKADIVFNQSTECFPSYLYR